MKKNQSISTNSFKNNLSLYGSTERKKCTGLFSKVIRVCRVVIKYQINIRNFA